MGVNRVKWASKMLFSAFLISAFLPKNVEATTLPKYNPFFIDSFKAYDSRGRLIGDVSSFFGNPLIGGASVPTVVAEINDNIVFFNVSRDRFLGLVDFLFFESSDCSGPASLVPTQQNYMYPLGYDPDSFVTAGGDLYVDVRVIKGLHIKPRMVMLRSYLNNGLGAQGDVCVQTQIPMEGTYFESVRALNLAERFIAPLTVRSGRF